ncbi:MAG: glycosyltransferase family 4 protein [Candidatus Zixiibacteriota bacterium]
MNSEAKSTKVNVLHLIASEFVGGPEKQLLTHCRYYDKSQFTITVGSFKEGKQDNDLIRELNKTDTPAIEINHRHLLDFSIIPQLKRQLLEKEIDILITHGYKSNIVGYFACKNTPVVQAMYVRGWTSENWKVALYNKLDLCFLKRAKIIVTVADNKRRELTQLQIAPERIRYIANAVEIPMNENRRPLREKYSLGGNTLLIIAAGRLSPEKGHRQLLLALKELETVHHDFFCVIFGDGVMSNSLIELAERLNLSAKVVLAGFDRSWRDYCYDADLLVNPSLSEVMPNVVLEGMAARCPVVATDVGGVSELITDGETGFLAEPGSPGSLCNAINRFLKGRHAIDLLTARAFKHVSENFSFASQTAKLNNLYEELARMKSESGNK